ncbi:MAG: hypothetical protein ABIN67_00280 [Ferruginibacter sp.]
MADRLNVNSQLQTKLQTINHKPQILKLSSQHKNIVILGSAHPLRGGGIATFNERLAREFMRLGNKVSIYSFSLQYPGFLFPGTSQYTNEPAPSDLDIHTRVNSVNPLNWIVVGNELKI